MPATLLPSGVGVSSDKGDGLGGTGILPVIHGQARRLSHQALTLDSFLFSVVILVRNLERWYKPTAWYGAVLFGHRIPLAGVNPRNRILEQSLHNVLEYCFNGFGGRPVRQRGESLLVILEPESVRDEVSDWELSLQRHF
jgi:hypothetical protein